MIYFVRHGATDWNEHTNANGENDAKCQGRADIELNAKGRRQAEETAKQLKDVKFDRIICSPLKRALETCKIINIHNVHVTVDERLIERDFGEFEGTPRSQFDFLSFWNSKHELKGNTSESIDDMVARVYDLLIELEEFPNENILLVSHGGVGIAVSTYFKGKPADGNYLQYGIPNGKVLIFDYNTPCY